MSSWQKESCTISSSISKDFFKEINRIIEKPYMKCQRNCKILRQLPSSFSFFLQWVEVLVCVNHLLVTINSSFNFLIYLMGSKRKPNNSKLAKKARVMARASQFAHFFAGQSTSYQTTVTVMRKDSSQSSNHACPGNPSVFNEVNGHLASPRNGVVQIELKFLDENNKPFKSCLSAVSDV